MSPARIPIPALALVLTFAVTGCDKPISIGGADDVAIAARDSVWTALRPEIEEAVEPRIFTVRDERIFEIAQVDPTTELWGDLRHLRRVLVIGTPTDPWVMEALEQAGAQDVVPPAIVQTEEVWAQNQYVTAVVLPPGSDPAAARDLVRQAGEAMLERYEAESRARMFATGIDSTTADSLLQAAGFWILAPEVYRVLQPEENVVMLRNDNPDPSQLIRQVEVAWRPAGEVELSPETALEWRATLAARLIQPPQVTTAEITEVREVTQDGRPALEIHGVWSNPEGEWPAAGPFIARMVACPDRTYLLDAWLYAPGRAKYPYMIQLQTLLDSFRCG